MLLHLDFCSDSAEGQKLPKGSFRFFGTTRVSPAAVLSAPKKMAIRWHGAVAVTRTPLRFSPLILHHLTRRCHIILY